MCLPHNNPSIFSPIVKSKCIYFFIIYLQPTFLTFPSHILPTLLPTLSGIWKYTTVLSHNKNSSNLCFNIIQSYRASLIEISLCILLLVFIVDRHKKQISLMTFIKGMSIKLFKKILHSEFLFTWELGKVYVPLLIHVFTSFLLDDESIITDFSPFIFWFKGSLGQNLCSEFQCQPRFYWYLFL